MSSVESQKLESRLFTGECLINSGSMSKSEMAKLSVVPPRTLLLETPIQEQDV